MSFGFVPLAGAAAVFATVIAAAQAQDSGASIRLEQGLVAGDAAARRGRLFLDNEQIWLARGAGYDRVILDQYQTQIAAPPRFEFERIE